MYGCRDENACLNIQLQILNNEDIMRKMRSDTEVCTPSHLHDVGIINKECSMTDTSDDQNQEEQVDYWFQKDFFDARQMLPENKVRFCRT